jgi:hypothetical protein
MSFIADVLEDTYVLTIDIVKGRGSDSRQTPDVVPALALFNASGEHSWISKRFAEKLGINARNRSAEAGGPTESVKLDWKCPALGRYVQRTVFMIAPLANFDVLFAEQRDENSRPSERDQFQRGIQKGLLKRVVQKGIADGTMLRVVQNPSGESPNTVPVMPTLAQLEAQLLHDTEGHRNYHRKHSCNIRSVHAIHSPACCQLLQTIMDPERRRSTSTTINESFSERHIASQSGSELSLCGDEGATYPVKRTKLNKDIVTGDGCGPSIPTSHSEESFSYTRSLSRSRSQSLGPSEISIHPDTVSAHTATDTFGAQLPLDGELTRREVASKSSGHQRNLRPRRHGTNNLGSRRGSMPKVGAALREIPSFTKRVSPDSSEFSPSPHSGATKPHRFRDRYHKQ